MIACVDRVLIDCSVVCSILHNGLLLSITLSNLLFT